MMMLLWFALDHHICDLLDMQQCWCKCGRLSFHNNALQWISNSGIRHRLEHICSHLYLEEAEIAHFRGIELDCWQVWMDLDCKFCLLSSHAFWIARSHAWAGLGWFFQQGAGFALDYFLYGQILCLTLKCVWKSYFNTRSNWARKVRELTY